MKGQQVAYCRSQTYFVVDGKRWFIVIIIVILVIIVIIIIIIIIIITLGDACVEYT